MYICNIPGFIYGRNLLTPITIYFEQTGTYKALNLTYPNFVALMSTAKTQGGMVLCQENGQFKLRLHSMLPVAHDDFHSRVAQKPLGSCNYSDYGFAPYYSKHQYIQNTDGVLHECL